MKKRINISTRAVNILVTSFLVIGPCIFDTIYYYAADDYLMNLIAQGAFGTNPDPFLIFSNSLLGYLLKGLYFGVPEINWYAVLQLLTVIICFLGINSALMRLGQTPWKVFPITGILELIVVYHLTFTIVAYVCIGAGCTYLLCAELEGKQQKICWKDLIVFVVFLLLGDWWRSGTMMTAIFVFAAPLIYVTWKNRKLLIYFLVAVFFIGAGRIADNELYRASDSVWKKYDEYNSLRGQVIDFPRLNYEEYQEQYEEIGLSKNDWECLYSWIFADKEVFSEEILKGLIDIQPIEKRYNLDIPGVFEEMFKLKYNYWFLGVLLLSSVFLKRKVWWMNIFLGFCTYGMVLGLFVRRRIVLRVLIPLYILGILAVLIWTCANTKENTEKWRWRVIGVESVLLIISVFCVLRDNSVVREKYEVEFQKYQQVRDHIKENSQYLYVGSSALVNPLEYSTDIFSVGEDINIENIIKLGSWDIYSQRYYDQLGRHKIENQNRLLVALAEDNVRYMVKDEEELILIRTYLEEHGKTKTEEILVKEFIDSGVKIIEF